MKVKALATLCLLATNLITTPAIASLPKLKPGYGWVVIAVDDPPQTVRKPVIFGLRVSRFDTVKKKPVLFFGWVTSPTEAEMDDMVDDTTGRRFLVGQMKEADAAVIYFSTQGAWGMCVDKQTVSFHVIANQFNLVGSFDPMPSISKVEAAVITGKMPEAISNYQTIDPLMGESLDGFTPASNEPNLKAESDTFLSRKFSLPVSTVEPIVTTTGYNKTLSDSGKPACFRWANKSDYPDR